ncbi:MAG: hypothetical protein CMJ76_12575 [Planctomycetaceae bacterium]|nr:hypothetical protein [Planctomycetaceae bacterium]|tara:strand:+ start:1696 stop:2880 length:1185 start_codon:yes stop_codon:yes gene_type:complete
MKKSSPGKQAPRITLIRKIVFATMSLMLFVGVCEFSFQAIGFDFGKLGQDLNATPIFYHVPTEPFGTAYYKRPGNQTWTGKVITAQMQRIGYDPKWFPDEHQQTLKYDADGFRNPDGLTHWKITMIGDSFTELGNLKQDQLVTSQLSKLLNVQVKNLGVSHTGLLNQTEYLRAFGISEQTEEVIWVFFEGNDIQDYMLEMNRVSAIQTGDTQHIDLLRAYKPQTSLVKAVYQTIFSKSRKEIYGPAVNATLSDGQTQFKIDYAPPGSDQIFLELQRYEAGIEKLHELCKQNELKLTCLYMPCKRRAFSGHHYTVNADAPDYLQREWVPSDLPDSIRQVCREKGIRFIDVTPVLQNLNQTDLLSHNLIFDTHLTAAGAEAVAQTLAGVLQTEEIK